MAAAVARTSNAPKGRALPAADTVVAEAAGEAEVQNLTAAVPLSMKAEAAQTRTAPPRMTPTASERKIINEFHGEFISNTSSVVTESIGCDIQTFTFGGRVKFSGSVRL